MKSASALTLAFALSSAALHAQVPALMSYQGRVVDSSGNGLGTGTPVNRKIIFRLFDAGTGGNRLWSEEQTVTLANGDFSVILGQGVNASFNGVTESPRPSLLTVFGGTDRYLEIVVDNGDGNFNNSDTPITPRQRLISTAFALRAATADSVASGTDLKLLDDNHGLGWYGTGRLFNGVPVNGPVLYGYDGGALGSNRDGTRSTALQWNQLGNVGIGSPASSTRLSVNGALGIFDGGNRAVNGGISSEFNGGLLQFGVNEDSTNRFGGTYNAALQGGLFRVDTRASEPLFNFFARPAGNTGIMTRVASISSSGTFSVGSVNLSASHGLRFPGAFDVNTTNAGDFVGTNGNSISFAQSSVSEDFIGYKNQVFYFRDAPGGGDSAQPSIDVGNAITAGGAISAGGNISATGNLSAANITTGNLTVGGNQTISGTSSILFKDSNHGVGYYGAGRQWNGIDLDGPVLFGYGGGILGTMNGTTASTALRWSSNGDVAVTGNVTANGKTAAVGEEVLRFIRGTVSNNGTKLRGSGFASVRSGIRYNITFDTAFSAAPSVVATVNVDDAFAATVYNVTTTGCTVRVTLTDNKESHHDREFSFIAAGPR